MADYKVTDTELTSIANAIRTKGGTSSQLEFPTGFVSAVEAIPTGGSALETPYATNVGDGWVSSGTWYVGTSSSLADVYSVESGKHYLIFLETPVGNRFRAMFTQTNVIGATSNVSGTPIGSDVDDPYPYMVKSIYTAPANGYIVIGKTNSGQANIKTYVIQLEKL